MIKGKQDAETLAECSVLLKFREGKNFNLRDIFSGSKLMLTQKLGKNGTLCKDLTP